MHKIQFLKRIGIKIISPANWLADSRNNKQDIKGGVLRTQADIYDKAFFCES